MKTLTLFLLISLNLNAWVRQAPFNYNAVQFISPSTGWIIGQNGKIMKSTDGGINWNAQAMIYRDLYDISFTDENNGIVVGNYGTVLKTTNGGTTWVIKNSGTNKDLKAVSFYNNIGMMISGPWLWRTMNGGNSWTQIYTATRTIHDIFIVDTSSIFVVGSYGLILHSTDLGTTWTVQQGGNFFNLNTITFTNSDQGIIAGEGGTILRTTNAGTNWSQQPVYNSDYRDISFSDNLNGVIIGSSSYVLKTTDGGITWGNISPVIGGDFSGVSQMGASTIIIVGTTGSVRRTTNGGSSWIDQSMGTYRYFTGLSITGYLTAAVVGLDGMIFTTTDGGGIWCNRSAGNQHLNAVSFADALYGIAVGSGGQIIRTINGGIDWSVQTSGITSSLLSVHMLDQNKCFTAGSDGVLLYTTNGGNNWFVLSSGTSNTINELFFTDENTGFAVGNGGLILKTADGGLNWAIEPSGTTVDLNAVSFCNSNYGFAVGAEGTILKTIDGGENWTLSVLPLPFWPLDLTGISYVDPNIAFITISDAQGGKIYRTLNGGTNWTLQYAQANSDLSDIKFINPSCGIAVGAGGTILRTEAGGIPVELTSFDAISEGNHVTIHWATATELNNRGFEIERKNNGSWRTIGFVTGNGTTSDISNYTYTDNLSDLQNISSVFYKLKQVDYNGSYEYSKEIEVTFALEYILDQNYPNPFNPVTNISYSIPHAGKVCLIVYDALGRELRKIIDEEKAPGKYEADFNATGLTSGVYFYQLRTGSFIQTKKMILLK